MSAGRIAPPVVAAAGLVLLGRLGGDGLDVPLESSDAFTAWLGTTAAGPLAMALARLVGQVICGYLLLTTALQLLAAALGYRWLHVLAARALPAVLRRTLTGGAGLGLAAGSVLWTGAPAGASHRPAVEVVAGDERASDPPTLTMTRLQAAPAPHPASPTATMRLLDTAPAVADDPAPHPAPTATMRLLEVVAAGLPGEPAPAPPGMGGADEDEIWVVEGGDSFWSIAEDVVGTGAALDSYWHQLIAANRDRLAVPDLPDLLFPGQILTLPRPAPPGGGR